MKFIHLVATLIVLLFVQCSKGIADKGDIPQPVTKFTSIGSDTLVHFDDVATNSIITKLKSKPLNITSEYAWICFDNISKDVLMRSTILESIRYMDAAIEDGRNVELLNYYGGVYLRPIPSQKYAPVLLNQSSASKKTIDLNTVYTGSTIPVGDDALIELYIKRGNMVVLSENSDGTGASKVYIAIDHDCEIQLDESLKGKVSFLRATPWNYVCKRGEAGIYVTDEDKLVGAQWYYNWGLGKESTQTLEFVPMFWGKWGSFEDNIQSIVNKKYTNNILTFNEPDSPDQANMTTTLAADLYKTILKGGIRIGSPACREGVWKTWTTDFVNDIATRGYRIDFVAIHWYDWGNWSSTQSIEPNIDQLVSRFKADIDACYNRFHLPIWITEFNANTNRPSSVHAAFLNKAIPMLENHPNVERYAYFQPGSGSGHFVNKDTGTILEAGIAYNSVRSTPSVKDNNPIPRIILHTLK